MDSTIPDNLLEIDGYNLVRADHPSIVERGGVCICHKDSLSVGIINLHYIKKALLLEVAYNNKKVIVPVIYRSTSQNSGLIFYLILVLDMSKCKPSLCVITGDVIARSSSWWSKDISTTEGFKLFSLPPTIATTNMGF